MKGSSSSSEDKEGCDVTIDFNKQSNEINNKGDDEEAMTIKEFVISHLKETFIENLPSDTIKELPSFCKLNCISSIYIYI